MKDMPEFKNEEEEHEFWAEHDSTDYVDWSKAKRGVFPNLKPSTKTQPRADESFVSRPRWYRRRDMRGSTGRS